MTSTTGLSGYWRTVDGSSSTGRCPCPTVAVSPGTIDQSESVARVPTQSGANDDPSADRLLNSIKLKLDGVEGCN